MDRQVEQELRKQLDQLSVDKRITGSAGGLTECRGKTGNV